MNEEFNVEEIVEEVVESQDYTQLLTEIKQNTQAIRIHNQNIYVSVQIIMFFTILTFTWSCMRAWRKNILKGV